MTASKTLGIVIGCVAAVTVLGTSCTSEDDLAGRCEPLCEEGKKCPDSEPVDCAAECKKAEDMAKTAGCTTEAKAALDCGEGLSDFCEDEACKTQEDALSDCIVKYCLAHLDDPVCDDGSGGSGGGGSGTGATGGTGGGTGGTTTTPTPNCPYSVNDFSCDAACSNLKAIAAKCQDDPGLSQDMQALLSAAAQGSGTVCKATCASGSATYGQQWGCYQGVPVSADCTAIMGCSVANCPN
jgi:hypothetical protein